MNKTSQEVQQLLALDIGEKRIGVARANSVARLAQPLPTITVDGSELAAIKSLIDEYGITTVVVGWPRNMAGSTTKQTNYVQAFADKLEQLGVEVIKQDESLTSVLAEEQLRVEKHDPRDKAKVDERAALLILDDYLEHLA